MSRAGTLLLGLLASGAQAAAQDDVRSLAVVPRPWGSVVSVTLDFAVGSAMDPPGQEGALWLYAAALEVEAARALPRGSGVLRVTVDRGRTSATLLSFPGAWQQGWRATSQLLSRGAVSEPSLEEARRALLDRLGFESGVPVRDFQAELYALLAGDGSPWARHPSGAPATVGELAPAAVRDLGRRLLRLEEAVAVVVGPVAEQDVAPVLRARTGAVAATGPDRAVPEAVAGADTAATGALEVRDTTGLLVRTDTADQAPRVAPGLPGPPAALELPEPGGEGDRRPWRAGERKVVFREVTSTWIGVAFPVPAGMPRTSLELLAHTVWDAFHPSPPEPGIFVADTEIVEAPEGTLLLATLAVLPDQAERWESRLLALVRSIGEDPPNEGFFSWERRRFRVAALAAGATPEGEGARVAADLRRDGAPRPLEAEIRRLTAAHRRDAVRLLGEPRILVYGPDLVGGEP